MLPEFTLTTVCTWYTCRRTATTSAGRISSKLETEWMAPNMKAMIGTSFLRLILLLTGTEKEAEKACKDSKNARHVQRCKTTAAYNHISEPQPWGPSIRGSVGVGAALRRLARKSFEMMARYDTAISGYFREQYAECTDQVYVPAVPTDNGESCILCSYLRSYLS
ncbi:hypothetical protein BC826DRAFT_1039257 [Russula brevipes]|nr:hypothetical protein BC826DRAFT_1039257 [Russula brevipes]